MKIKSVFAVLIITTLGVIGCNPNPSSNQNSVIDKEETPVENELRAVNLDKEQSSVLFEKATKTEHLGKPNVQVFEEAGIRISRQFVRLYFDDMGGKLPGGGTVIMTTNCSGGCTGSCTTSGCNPSGDTCTPLNCSSGCSGPGTCTKTTSAIGNKGTLKAVFPDMPELEDPPLPTPPAPREN